MVLKQESVGLKKQFGERLRQLRKQRGHTQETLSESMDVTVETISNLERGIHGPSFETLERLIHALNFPAYQFFRFEPNTNLPDIL